MYAIVVEVCIVFYSIKNVCYKKFEQNQKFKQLVYVEKLKIGVVGKYEHTKGPKIVVYVFRCGNVGKYEKHHKEINRRSRMYEHDENKVNNLVGSVVKAHQIKFSEVKKHIECCICSLFAQI